MQKLNIKTLYSNYLATKELKITSNVTKAFLVSLFDLIDLSHDTCEISINTLLLNFKINLSNLENSHMMLPVTDLSHLLEHVALLVNGYPEIFTFNPDKSSALYVNSNIRISNADSIA